jgi:hypothetical protein
MSRCPSHNPGSCRARVRLEIEDEALHIVNMNAWKWVRDEYYRITLTHFADKPRRDGVEGTLLVKHGP